MIGRTGFVGDLIYSFWLRLIYRSSGTGPGGRMAFLATMGSAGNFCVGGKELPRFFRRFHRASTRLEAMVLWRATSSWVHAGRRFKRDGGRANSLRRISRSRLGRLLLGVGCTRFQSRKHAFGRWILKEWCGRGAKDLRRSWQGGRDCRLAYMMSKSGT